MNKSGADQTIVHKIIACGKNVVTSESCKLAPICLEGQNVKTRHTSII